MFLTLAERAVEGRKERPQHVVEGGSFLGDDHHRGRHAGVELDLRARGEIGGVDIDLGGVVGDLRALVCQPVGRDLGNLSVDQREHALLV